MASKLDDYKSDSANNFAEYAQQAKQYQSEIDTLSKDVSEKRESAFELSSELEGIEREDNPTLYDDKKADSEKAETAIGTAEGALNDKRVEYNDYQSDNPSYSVQMEQMEKQGDIGKTEELGDRFKSLDAEIEDASPETFAQDYEEREGQPENHTVYANDTVGGGNSEGAGGDSPKNSKLAELVEEAKKDPDIKNTSKAIEQTQETPNQEPEL